MFSDDLTRECASSSSLSGTDERRWCHGGVYEYLPMEIIWQSDMVWDELSKPVE